VCQKVEGTFAWLSPRPEILGDTSPCPPSGYATGFKPGVKERVVDEQSGFYYGTTSDAAAADPCMAASRHSSTHRRLVLSSSLVCATLSPSSFSTIDLWTSWMARSVSRISLFVCHAHDNHTDRLDTTNFATIEILLLLLYGRRRQGHYVLPLIFFSFCQHRWKTSRGISTKLGR